MNALWNWFLIASKKIYAKKYKFEVPLSLSQINQNIYRLYIDYIVILCFKTMWLQVNYMDMFLENSELMQSLKIQDCQSSQVNPRYSHYILW